MPLTDESLNSDTGKEMVLVSRQSRTEKFIFQVRLLVVRLRSIV